MLKLIIADDERIIRETISHIIDWKQMGIELTGLCRDGIEAYDMILDESPDIVLTDIKMPGFSGLELIKKISDTDLDTQFILLSGYGEFSYAKEAMKYGVRHYLLKPCNEEQIITSIQEVIKDCYHKKAFKKIQEQQKLLLENLYDNVITNIINEGVSTENDSDSLFQPYAHYLDFTGTGYELCYLYFLEEDCLMDCLRLVKEYNQVHAPGIPLHGLYVHNTLLLFFQSYQSKYHDFDDFINSLSFPCQQVSITYQRKTYASLGDLLKTVIHKVKRYGTIYCIRDYHLVPTCNYKNLMKQIALLADQILLDGRKEAGRELLDLLCEITSPDFLKQLASHLMMRFSSRSSSCSPISATEFLLEVNKQGKPETIQQMILQKLQQVLNELMEEPSKHGDFIQQIFGIVEEQLSNPNLTLKWIAEHDLYMNVDYVSRKFIRETGMKFSNYLTEQRIRRAKELLTGYDTEKIQYVAEKVGCGNNPQYFSQIFKKQTGMTPSAYAREMGERAIT